MKKILIILIIILLGALLGSIIWNGVSLVKFNVLSIRQIEERNDNTDELIAKADKLANFDYIDSMKRLKEQQKNVEKAQKEYLDKASISTEEELKLAYQEVSYELEKLQVKIGNYARKYAVNIDMRITDSDSSTQNINLFNINFTVDGQYVNISDFVYSLENDSELGFKIENFKMTPGTSDDTLQATFKVSDIAINIDKSMVQNSPTLSEENKDEEKNDNTTTTNTQNQNKQNTQNTQAQN